MFKYLKVVKKKTAQTFAEKKIIQDVSRFDEHVFASRFMNLTRYSVSNKHSRNFLNVARHPFDGSANAELHDVDKILRSCSGVRPGRRVHVQ